MAYPELPRKRVMRGPRTLLTELKCVSLQEDERRKRDTDPAKKAATAKVAYNVELALALVVPST